MLCSSYARRLVIWTSWPKNWHTFLWPFTVPFLLALLPFANCRFLDPICSPLVAAWSCVPEDCCSLP